jgi:predicted ArsR family transcriptional regulator
MARRGSSARAAALRRAQQAKAARDAARLSHEKDIEAALADYFQATGHAGQLRTDARQKADRLLADAEQAAQAPRQAARSALHRLRELVGNATEVASLCGITTSEVRSLLAADPAPHQAASGDGDA